MRDDRIPKAAEVLRAGGLVAFPTETVYGLGADATNADAVAKVFALKGRPPTNPLIVHVTSAEVARRYATDWPPAASRLADAFWPGPLTLVLPKSNEIVPAVTAGLGTVGLRVPNHPLALNLLRAFGGPIAAPSANRSNRVSPTTAQDVRDEFGDAVDVVLDAGRCAVGIESTVLDLTSEQPVILRPGGVTREQIEAVIGQTGRISGPPDPATPARSPGLHARHYSPAAAAFQFDSARRGEVEAMLLRPENSAVSALLLGEGMDGIVAAVDDERTAPGWTLYLPRNSQAYARVLYSALRMADEPGVREVWIEMPPDGPEWEAVRDRIARATRPL